MKNHKTVFVLSCLASFAVSAATWTIYPTDQDGMTPSQQLTNAVTRASSGDTILFKPGTYQLDGESFMETTSKGSGASAVTSRNYVFLNSKPLNFVGEAEGAWSDEVVLRGNGYDRFMRNYACASTCRNITFENFAASDRPDLATDSNLGEEVTGGAIRYSSYSDENMLSNCVFRGNVSRSAGAVAYAMAIDCLFTNNVARSYGGGAAMGANMRRCLCVDNMATNNGCFGGAIWWPNVLRDCSFIGNRSKLYAGALVGNGNMSVSNCVFRGNVAEGTVGGYWHGGGGAATLRDNAKFLDCVFEGNHAEAMGGAINTGQRLSVRPLRILRQLSQNSRWRGERHDHRGRYAAEVLRLHVLRQHRDKLGHGGLLRRILELHVHGELCDEHGLDRRHRRGLQLA